MNNKKIDVLIVEDDERLGELLRQEAEDAEMVVRLAHNAEDAFRLVLDAIPDIIVSDLRLPVEDGLTFMKRVQRQGWDNTPDFIIITAFGSVTKAVESLKNGAADFLTKPLDLDHFKICLQRVHERRMMRQHIHQFKELLNRETTFHGLQGRSPSMLKLFGQIRNIAKAEGPVLMIGESGTGKELIARAIHEESPNHEFPFLAVNCAGIPEALLESEFFGHEAGAFTGAGKPRRGLFKEAEGGTLLLDEIAEMPVSLQAKLLRVLQDGRIRPVGSDREKQVNVRIIAATNQNLEQMVKKGEFREDLFYRLETFQLHIPPLRDREGDLDLLAGIFLNRYATAAGKAISGFQTRAQDVLNRYPFPGNVRELQNAIERAVTYCQDREIRLEHLPARIRKSCRPPVAPNGSLLENAHFRDNGLPTLDAVEKDYIRHVLEKVDGNKRKAATVLGITRKTLYRKIEEIHQQATQQEETPPSPFAT